MWRESQTRELKTSLARLEKIAEAVVAFANAEGGKVYVGVTDEGKIQGVDIGKNTLENIGRQLTEQIYPAIYPKIEVLTIEEKNIIAIEVTKSAKTPHFFKGIAYKRVGKINKIIDPKELEVLFRSRLLEVEGFDEQAILYGAAALDVESIHQFCQLAKQPYVSPEQALSTLGLLKKNRLKIAAVLFFGKDPTQLVPLYGLRCALVKGEEIFDFQLLTSNIFHLVEQGLNYLRQKLPQKLIIEGAIRKQEPIIPEAVLREALLNALIHADYSANASLYLTVREKELEIKNPGRLPESLTIADLYRAHESYPRNKLLAKLALRCGFIEQWGFGTFNMVKAMRQRGLADPVFKEEGLYFKLLLPFAPPVLNKKEEKLLKQLRQRSPRPAKALARGVGLPERTIRHYLARLVREGFVKKEGTGRNTIYRL